MQPFTQAHMGILVYAIILAPAAIAIFNWCGIATMPQGADSDLFDQEYVHDLAGVKALPMCFYFYCASTHSV